MAEIGAEPPTRAADDEYAGDIGDGRRSLQCLSSDGDDKWPR